MNSNLASAALQEKEAATMTIRQLHVADYQSKTVTTTIRNVLNEDKDSQVTVKLFTIECEDIDGYLPSKVWADESGQFNLLFYCTPSLPAGARPFQGGPIYFMAFPVGLGEVIEYDVSLRVFVDQVIINHHCWYVFMFGQDQYDKVVV
jgi:hypothetical protein